MKNKLRIATVFSGIGAIEFALKRMGIDHEIVFACDNGERDVEYDTEKERDIVFNLASPMDKKIYVDELYDRLTRKTNFVEKSYLANYPQVTKDKFYQDIVLLDGRDYKGKVDLFVGGSPCQSFSSVGFQGGLEDARGTLFYEFARLVKEIQPKIFIYENVRNLLKHDHGNTWKVIQSIFDSLGYHYKYAVLNAADYGIPQNRRRLFVVGFKDENDFEFPEPVELKCCMKDFCIDNCDFGYFNSDGKGGLVVDKVSGIVDKKYYLSPKIYAYVMKSGTKNWHQPYKINLDIARTLLKTMGNHHRAGVDNYLSFDRTENLGSVRNLTEREALRLMGFTDDFKIVVSKGQTYRQAGNSIVVDVMIQILKIVISVL